MDYTVRFAYPWVWYFLVPLLVLGIIVHLFWRKKIYYTYSLGSLLADSGFIHQHQYHEKILFLIRFFTLIIMGLFIAKPQLIDLRSKVTVEGIDIVLVLDVSGSMQFQDYEDDQRSRIEVAKDEAVRFIDKRTNDAIGLVIFGADALSRAPLTLDHPMLKSLIKDLQLGIINPDGTVLATAIVTAANRLKSAKAASKIMILLTDGEPSEHDVDPQMAIDIAKKLGIKIYTIGIGSDEERLMQHPFLGIIRAPKINSALLTRIAQETGGKFFLARSSADMRTIYNTIDELEKTEIETPIFNKYYDFFIPIIILLIGLMMLELLLVTFWWFRM